MGPEVKTRYLAATNHVCGICNKRFETGQGLGGHKSKAHPKSKIPVLKSLELVRHLDAIEATIQEYEALVDRIRSLEERWQRVEKLHDDLEALSEAVTKSA